MPRDLPDDCQPITLQEAQDRLAALHGEMAERGYAKHVVVLMLEGVSRPFAQLRPTGWRGDAESFAADDPAEALAKLEAAVRALPDPNEEKRREAIKALLNAVDGCRDAGLDADFVNQLADAARKLAERALPAPAPTA